MLQNLRKRSRRAFTLAELLIVVAIIAVLTAIAVPLFVNALSDADEKVKAANIRAVRVAATDEILFKLSDNDDGYKAGETSGWFVKAVISSGGDITDLDIFTTNNDKANEAKYTTEGTAEQNGDDGYDVYLKLTKLTAGTASPSTSVGP